MLSHLLFVVSCSDWDDLAAVLRCRAAVLGLHVLAQRHVDVLADLDFNWRKLFIQIRDASATYRH